MKNCEICSKELGIGEYERCDGCWGGRLLKIFLNILFLILLGGCASLPDKAFDISEGDSESKIVTVLGKPSFYLQSTRTRNAMAYYYQKSGYVCGFTVYNKVIIYRYCIVDNDSKATALDAQRINMLSNQFESRADDKLIAASVDLLNLAEYTYAILIPRVDSLDENTKNHFKEVIQKAGGNLNEQYRKE